MTVSTHVLDTSIGRPASGVDVRFDAQHGDAWHQVSRAATDNDGRVHALVTDGAALGAGTYRLTFDVASYFRARGLESFYRVVAVEFVVRDGASHHHVPLLVSPYGYTTYRGS
jgi:5-hydroxyisourate hydrolase